MQDAAPVFVTLELRPGVDPVSGTLRVADGSSHAFSGWLQLTSLLQDAADLRAARNPTAEPAT